MPGLLNDVHHAIRQLLRSRGFRVFAVVVLRPLQYQDPDQIVGLSKSVTPVRFDARRFYSALGALRKGFGGRKSIWQWHRGGDEAD